MKMNTEKQIKIISLAVCTFLTVTSFSSATITQRQTIVDDDTDDINIMEGVTNQMTPDHIRHKKIPKSISILECEESHGHDGDVIYYQFQFDAPVIEELELGGHRFHTVTMSNLPTLNYPGAPVLPIKIVKLLLPHSKMVTDVKVVTEVNSLPGEYLIVPGQTPLANNTISASSLTSSCNFTPPNPAYYERDYPGIYSTYNVHILRGYQLLYLTLYPVQYHNGIISYYTTMSVTIQLESDLTNHQTYRGLNKDRTNLLEFDPLNSNFLDSYPESRQPRPEYYQYVILTTAEFEEAFQHLATWKASRANLTPFSNLSAVVVLLEDVTDDPRFWYNGCWGDGGDEELFNTTQCQIRNFIKMAYSIWGTEYVLLGGDTDPVDPVIPHRSLFVQAGSHVDCTIPGDLYYGCLDGNWNADGDNLWGEPTDGINGGEVDLLAEVFIGRAPIDTIQEACNVVHKTIIYEQTVACNDPYLKNMLMIGGYLDEQTVGGNANDAITEITPEYTTKKAYWRDRTLNVSFLLNDINSGMHIINYNGHSTNDYFLTSTPPGIRITRDDINQLTNDRYSFVYSVGCSSAAFDNRIPGGYGPNDAVGEIFVTSAGGAFAYIGHARYSWYSPGSINGLGERYNRAFYHVLYNISTDGESTNIGKILQTLKQRIWFDEGAIDGYSRWIYYSLNLLGDPEVQLTLDISAPTAHFSTHDDYILVPPTKFGSIIFNGTALGGTTPGATFDHYEIDYGEGFAPETWSSEGVVLTDQGWSEISHGMLGFVNSSRLKSRPYTLRLTVYDDQGVIGRDWLVLIIANQSSVINQDKNTSYYTIQAAIDDADPGDQIFIKSREYYETLLIMKPLILFGEDRNSTIVDGLQHRNVIEIHSDDVTLQNITIQHAAMPLVIGDLIYAGVAIYGRSSNNHVVGNTIRENFLGILSYSQSPNYIEENFIVDNRDGGIRFERVIEGGIISRNTIINSMYSVIILESAHLMITGNYINGISQENSGGIIIEGSSHNLTIQNNQIFHNLYGIISFESHHNLMVGNKIAENVEGVVLMGASSWNVVHNSFINNTRHAVDDGHNWWNHGYPVGGNYWDDFDEPAEGAYDAYQGIYQNVLGADGVIDQGPPDGGLNPYQIPGIGENRDIYPLKHPFLLGDMNVDGRIDSFDIDPFVLATIDPLQYQELYHILPTLHGDINQDGVVDSFDVDPFVQLVVGR